MDSSKTCQAVVFLFVVSLVGITDTHVFSHDNARSLNGPPAQSFVDSLFDKYGTNKSMNLAQFSALLKELKVGSIYSGDQKSSDGSAKESGVKDKCYPAQTLFTSFSINSDGLNQSTFENICPAIVEQIESKACLLESDGEKEDEENGKPSNLQSWGYGFIAVTIISLLSLLGAFVVPFMDKTFYQILLLVMLSLAVGVLCGSGIFHLIPHALSLGKFYPDKLDFLWKCLVIVGGIYLFFFLEYAMKMIVRFKQKSSCDGNQELTDETKKPKVSEIPGEDIAAVQLQLYNVNPDHHQALQTHKPATCIDQLMPHVQIRGSQSSTADLVTSENGQKASQKRKVAPVAWMIIIGDGLHNFIDGLAIGASFSTSSYVGVSTSLAILCEELPHELGDFAVLLTAGMSYKRALCFNFLSACLCYLGLVIGLWLGSKPSAVKWIYPLAGGMFIYIALVDMLQEACEMSAKIGQTSLVKNIKTFALQNFGMLFGFAIMFIISLYAKKISV